MNSSVPLVSVSCLTYNHQDFLRQCLDGILVQKVNFPMEIVIHDDASTDNTVAILKEYQDRYPDRLRLLLQKENQLSKGQGEFLKTHVFPHIRGKYLAMCEGDDYWTDPLKLQKQVDFLESHPHCALCFHDVQILKDGVMEPKTYSNRYKDLLRDKELLGLSEILQDNFIPTCSIVVRFDSLKQSLSWKEKIQFHDWALWISSAHQGSLCYLADVAAVYRIHAKGVWSSLGTHEQLLNKLHFFRILKGALAPEHQHHVFTSLHRFSASILDATRKESDFLQSQIARLEGEAHEYRNQIQILKHRNRNIFYRAYYKMREKISPSV